MYELCLDPETARRLAESRPEPETRNKEAIGLPKLPEIAPETDATTERPVKPSEHDLSVAFAMILHWSKYGGC